MAGSRRTTWTAALAALALGAAGCGKGEMKCPAGQTNCGGVCVDTTSDSNNCVYCGFRCAAGASCTPTGCQCPAGEVPCGGTCVSLSLDPNCGACGHVCGALGTCGGTPPGCACNPSPVLDCTASSSPQCVDPSEDGLNCGGCGIRCGAAGVCTAGVCVCSGATTLCAAANPRCVDLSSDANNCGSCGHACATGETCSDGLCCPAGETNCSGACQDLLADPSNCGACGNGCLAPSPTCSLGKCCPTGQTNCSGTCIDTSSDPANCGACGHVCGAGESCTLGICCAGAVCGSTPACCQGTTCCSGNVCPPAHANGLGQSYYDCKGPGTPGTPATYDLVMAGEAAAAWSPSGTTEQVACGTELCLGRLTSGSPRDCAVWCYTGTVAGYVGHSSAATIACVTVCPVIGGGNTFTWH